VRAKNLARSSDQQNCSPYRPAVMITGHMFAVHVPVDYAVNSDSSRSWLCTTADLRKRLLWPAPQRCGLPGRLEGVFAAQPHDRRTLDLGV